VAWRIREGHSVNDEELDRVISAFFGKFPSALPVFLAFWWSSWCLGVQWWKAPVVGMIAASLFIIGWGARWISRLCVFLVVLATLVWIEALPRPQEWSAIVSSLATKFK
jgi:hypothetical protein